MRDREPDLRERAKEAARSLRDRDRHIEWATAFAASEEIASLIEELLAELEKKPPEGG